MSTNSAGPPDSHARFPTTSWTLVRDLQNLAVQQRRELYEALLRRYWKPLYAYFRSKRKSPEQSADLVQDFLQRFLEGDKILQANRADKRFRDWLMVSARNFLIDEVRKEKAAKRGPDQGISFEALRSETGAAYEPAADESPESAYTEAWRRGILQQALAAVAEQSALRGRTLDYQIFCAYYLSDSGDGRSWKDLARDHELADWREANRKAEWVKAQLVRFIRGEIRRYVDSESDVDQEIRDLLQ